MKKILLAGELNQIMGSLEQHLSGRYQTQMCMDNLEMVKGIGKIFQPDMAVISLIGAGGLDHRILDFFLNQYEKMPVLLVGTAEACESYQKYYENSRIDYIVRPTSLHMLLQKCEELMKEYEMAAILEEIPELAPVAAEKKRILAVDDSGILLRSVKSILEKQYDVLVANSGEAAIRQAKKKMPDLILLDYEMPEMDGRETLEIIRNDEDLKEIPVVFLTAIADKAHIAAVLKLHPSGYLLKPIDKQVLIDTIEKALVQI